MMFDAEMNNNDKSDVDRECASADKPSGNDKTSDVKTPDNSRKVTSVELVSADGKSFNGQEKVARKFKFGDAYAKALMRDIEADILKMTPWAEDHVNDELPDYDSEDDNDSMGKRTDGGYSLTDDIDEWERSLNIPMFFRLLKQARCMGKFSQK